MKTIIDSRENINKTVAERICALVKDKPDAVIAFAAGETQRGIFSELCSSGAELTQVRAFVVAEYVGLSPENEASCVYMLKNELFDRLGITDIHVPDEYSPEGFDADIAACGGLDLAVLGIGLNGHIGFNEPGTLYDTYTHTAQLTDSTKRMKAASFGGAENVPAKAVTMGLKTICNARNVILTAFGEEKADIIHKLVYGKTMTYVPAAMLQMHMNMTLCIDEKAASKLD